MRSSLLLAALAACGPSTPSTGSDAAPAADATSDAKAPAPLADAGPGCSEIDILFVIDRSTSMFDEKENLLANFPTFVAALDDADPAIDYRVAVIDDTMSHLKKNFAAEHWISASDGRLHAPAECALPRPWVEKSDANPAQEFSCIADIPLDDSITTFEMPLGAVVKSLDPWADDVATDGFLRPDALFGVVILTDEDDHSAATLPWQDAEDGCPELQGQYLMDLDQVVASMDAAKDGRRDRWAVAVIAGTGPGDCQSDFGGACEARRLADFVDRAGDQGFSASICESDLTPALSAALQSFREACVRIID